jgi:type II secretory pathway pseudopilin PulG
MKNSHGFTLIEIVVTFMILGFVMGSVLIPITIQIDSQKIQTTKRRLDTIKKALIIFATNNGYLPCPALDTNGKEANRNTNGHICDTYDNSDGYLPWKTLGVEGQDAWGRIFRYRVDGYFSNSDGIFIEPSKSVGATKSELKITNLKGEVLNSITTSYRSNIAAIIFSCGKNGYPDSGTINSNREFSSNNGEETDNGNDADGILNSDALCTNQNAENATLNHYIQDNTHEFDDILVWLPKNILITHLALVGKWPPS